MNIWTHTQKKIGFAISKLNMDWMKMERSKSKNLINCFCTMTSQRLLIQKQRSDKVSNVEQSVTIDAKWSGCIITFVSHRQLTLK